MCISVTFLCISVSFLHGWVRLLAGGIVRATDAEGVHSVFQHPPADSEQVRGVSLYVIGSFQRVKDDFPFKLHYGFFKRHPTGEGIVSKRC